MFYKFYNTYYNRTTVILNYSVTLNYSPCYLHDYFIAGLIICINNLSHSKNDEFEYCSKKALFRGVTMTHILVIEDNPDIQELIREFLMAQNFTVDVVGAGTEGILLFQKIHTILSSSM